MVTFYVISMITALLSSIPIVVEVEVEHRQANATNERKNISSIAQLVAMVVFISIVPLANTVMAFASIIYLINKNNEEE